MTDPLNMTDPLKQALLSGLPVSVLKLRREYVAIFLGEIGAMCPGVQFTVVVAHDAECAGTDMASCTCTVCDLDIRKDKEYTA